MKLRYIGADFGNTLLQGSVYDVKLSNTNIMGFEGSKEGICVELNNGKHCFYGTIESFCNNWEDNN